MLIMFFFFFFSFFFLFVVGGGGWLIVQSFFLLFCFIGLLIKNMNDWSYYFGVFCLDRFSYFMVILSSFIMFLICVRRMGIKHGDKEVHGFLFLLFLLFFMLFIRFSVRNFFVFFFF